MFGKYNVGDKLIIDSLKSATDIECEYLGERVDLSRIKPCEHNIIVVVNRKLYSMDFTKIIGMIKKDLTTPLIVVNKLNTFGAVCLGPNLDIEQIVVNKIMPFAGILYVPKALFKLRVSDILKSFKKDELRVYIHDSRKRA